MPCSLAQESISWPKGCMQSWNMFFLKSHLWNVILSLNFQPCIKIALYLIRRNHHLLSLSTATALANSLVSSKFDWLLQFTILWHLTNKSQQTSWAFKIHWHVSLQTLQNINTSHQHSKNYTGFLSNKKIDYKLCLLTYKTLTNQQPTYLYNSLSFPSHSVSTRSSDLLVLSIPYVRSSIGKRTFSVIGPRLWNSLSPDTWNSSSLPIFRSWLKTHLFKIAFPP